MSGIQGASILRASDQGLDIADVAIAAMSGTTSQVNMNSLVEALRGQPRETGLNPQVLNSLSHYWQAARDYYAPFETGMKAGDADLYIAQEMPGGQSTNLYQQATALGLAHRWEDLCRLYADVNQLFGDIVRVTRLQNRSAIWHISAGQQSHRRRCPGSRSNCLSGIGSRSVGRPHGRPSGGWPADVQKRIVRNHPSFTERPGASLPPADFAATAQTLEKQLKRSPTQQEVLSHLLYPRVFEEFADHQQAFSDVSVLPTCRNSCTDRNRGRNWR